MKILWITNYLFPEAESKILGLDSVSNSSGGWLLALSQVLASDSSIELTVATVSPSVKELTKVLGERIIYYVLPYGKGNFRYNKEYEAYWRDIQQAVKPDIIHIHGTEFSHGLAFIRACGKEHVVVSLQGIATEIARRYTLGLNHREIIKNISIRDLFKGGIFSEKRRFEKRGVNEKKIIESVDYVFGRTSFDKSFALSINPQVQYFCINECLRDPFYFGRWQYNTCIPHSIFLSQAHYPIKGLHIFLRSLPAVIKRFEDCHIYVSGSDITRSGMPLRSRLQISGYGRIIKSLIKEYKLDEHIHFIGSLDAEGIKRELLRAELFVCPSTCENSPNSLCEAQMLGTPCVASNVGGISDLINDERCGVLYDCMNIEELSEIICDSFYKSKFYDNSFMIDNARKRHHRERIINDLLCAYNNIVDLK